MYAIRSYYALFAVAFMRNQAGALMPDVNPDFVRLAREEGWYSDDLMERIATEGHIHFDEVPDHVQRVFRTAHDIVITSYSIHYTKLYDDCNGR